VKRPVVFGLLAIGAAACVGKITLKTVRDKASQDLSCKPDQIKVAAVGDAGDTYRADGCKQHAVYVCEGWDSYDQEPVCQRQ